MILALDVSLTSTGVALYDDNFVPFGVHAIRPKCFGLDRYLFILQQLTVTLEAHRKDLKLVVFEGYPYFLFSHAHQKSANFNAGNQVFGLAGITEMIKMKIHFNYGLPFACIAPNSIKLFATGNGRARKPEMIAQLDADFGLRYSTDDEVDACWIGLMGAVLYYHRLGVRMPAHMMALLRESHRKKSLTTVLASDNPEGTFSWAEGKAKLNLWNRKGAKL